MGSERDALNDVKAKSEVNFDALPNESDRKFFKSLPTSLKLPPATVDRVRSAAARLLRQSENYQKLPS